MNRVAGPSPNRNDRGPARSIPRAVLHQGMFAAANGRFLRLLGYPSFADLQAIPFLDLVPSASQSDVKRGLEGRVFPFDRGELGASKIQGTNRYGSQVAFHRCRTSRSDCATQPSRLSAHGESSLGS